VVVLDLSMPELNGLDAARQIRKKMPEADVLIMILTLHDGEDLTRAALESGAAACVVKTDLQRLIKELRTLLQSNRELTSDVSSKRAAAPQQTSTDETFERLMSRLTDREHEILQLLAQSKTNKEIATALALNLKTVEACRAAIMHKLEIDSIVELLRYTLRKKRVEV
jgi:two-component system response regulator NreC